MVFALPPADLPAEVAPFAEVATEAESTQAGPSQFRSDIFKQTPHLKMSRIIDLKNNKSEKPKPENERKFAAKLFNPPVRPQAGLTQSTAISQTALKNLIQEPASSKSPERSAFLPDEHKEREPRTISWSDRPYHHPDFKAVIAVSLGLFAVGALAQIFQKNVITTVFFGLLGAVLLLNANKKPRESFFEIGGLGIKADGKSYGYREIKSFWIEYEPALGIKELSLQFKKWYMLYLKIPLGEQNPVQIRLVLLNFVPEIEHQDTFVEILSRRLGL